ncbi:tmRNA tag peptide, partial [Acinetobacter baumannii NCGM 237]
ANDETYALAA